MDFGGIVAFSTKVVVPESVLLFIDRIHATKVNYFDPPIYVRELEWSINHDVLKLEVEVEQSKGMHVFDTLQNLSYKETADTLTERPFFEHVKKSPPSYVLKNK